MRRQWIGIPCWLLLALPAAAQTPATPPFEATFAELKALTVSGTATAPATIVLGRATLRPAAGSRLVILMAGGRPCGGVIDGQVALEYRIEDRFSSQVAQRTLAKTRLRRLDGSGQSHGMSLRGAAFWGWGLEGLQVTGGPAPLPNWLRDAWQRRLWSSPLPELMMAAWNGDAGYRFAILHGDDDYVLDVDPRGSAAVENLGRFRRLDYMSSLSGRAVTESLVGQPIGRAWWDAPNTDFVSVASTIDVRNDAANHAVIETRTRLRMLRDGMRMLPLRLIEDVLDERGKRRPQLLESLMLDGKAARYAREGSDLLVELPRALASGEEILLESRTGGDVLVHPGGDNYWWLGTGSWYPRPGLGGEERASFDLSIQTRGSFLPFAGGEVVRREKTAAGNRLVTHLSGPMEAAVALAGRYQTYTEEAGRRVHVSTYGGGKEEEARRVARIVLGVSKCLETWLDMPYPFEELQVIEVNDWGFGQAPPGVIFITQEAFMNRASASVDAQTRLLSRLAGRGVTMRVAHEVAHGWFPHVMKVESPEEAWLSESFADYVSAVCLKRVLSDAALADRLWEAQMVDWKALTEEAGKGASIYLLNWLTDSEEDQAARWQLLYGKGPLVLHALRLELARVAGSKEQGDQVFFGWMRNVVQNHIYQTGKTADLISELDRITGRSWQPWFERYVYGTETPLVE